MAWVLLLLVTTAPIFTTRRVIGRLDDMEEEQLSHVRRQATSQSSRWYIWAWSALLLATSVVALARGRHVGASVVLGVAVILAAAPLVLARRNRELLDALGDRGRIPRTDRYHRRDRRSAMFGAVALFGWFIGNLSDIVLPDRGTDDWTWMEVLGAVVFMTGVVGWLAVRTRMYVAGDDLEQPTEADRDGRRG
jgi:hypothetical protein